MNRHYDAIIIGFGKGGKTLAAYLGDKGQSVAVLERWERMYGGTCINIACIPTKTLAHDAKRSVSCGEPDFPAKAEAYRRAIARKNEVTAFLRAKNYAMLADHDNVDVITGTASFRSPHEVEVAAPDGPLVLSADKFFINSLAPLPGEMQSYPLFAFSSHGPVGGRRQVKRDFYTARGDLRGLNTR